MARGRSGRSPGGDTTRNGGPTAGEYPIDTGIAELVPDGDAADGWLLKINGVQSSHLVLSEPLRLDFEYMRWIAALVEDVFPPDAGRLRVLHQGGGACSMARYVAARYVDSRQLVVELDATLAGLVREWFELPKAPLLRIRAGEAREVTESLTPESRDVVIRDVFAGSETPRPLTTVEFTEASARLLAPGGVYVANIACTPDQRSAREEAAVIAEVFPELVAIADPATFKGRRRGNVILAGSHRAFDGSPGLRRSLLGGGVPAQLWDTARVREWIRGAGARRDG